MDEFKFDELSELVRQGIKIMKLGISDEEKSDRIVELIEQYRKVK